MYIPIPLKLKTIFFKTIFTEHIGYDPNKRRELKNEHHPNQLDDQNRIALVILYNCICTVRSAHTAVAEQFWLKLGVTVELYCAKRKVIRKLMTVSVQWTMAVIPNYVVSESEYEHYKTKTLVDC